MYLFDIMLFDISLYIFFKLSEFPLVTKLVRYVFWDWGLIFFCFQPYDKDPTVRESYSVLSIPC
jgi:hypothetical protein